MNHMSENRQLGHAIAALLGQDFKLQRCASRPWASANFHGQRHEFWLQGEALDRTEVETLEARIAESEFEVDGAIVADARLKLATGNALFYVEALTVAN